VLLVFGAGSVEEAVEALEIEYLTSQVGIEWMEKR
jgi:hypothetical protein